MAYVITRNKRHTGYFRNKNNRVVSAGTFDSRAKALSSAILAEGGLSVDESESNQTLEAYLEEWLIRTDVRLITKKTYKTSLKKYVIPSLGNKQVLSITKRDVRSLFEKLLQEGVSPSTVLHVKIALGSAFRPLVQDERMVANPTHGVRVKVPQSDPFINLEPDDFKQIVANLPTDGAKLFAQFLIATGCRFGEATELRVKDFNFKSKEVYIRRTVCDIGKKANNGSRFLIVHTTKNNHKRTVVISTTLLKAVKAFIADKKLSNNDLLFGNNTIEVGKLIHAGSSSVRTNETFTVKGRVFNHATPYAYNVGKCRCDLCKQAIKDYRKQYRKDKSKGREILSQNTGSGHLSRTKWRTIWNEAIEKSGIGWYPKTHDLRHANATQLLKKGVDVHEVKERLGHQSITTTERYLHRIRHQQSKAGELADEYLLGER